MAQSHHRKHHKEHLKNYHQQHQGQSNAVAPKKSSASFIFAAIGAIIGFGIPFFAGGSSYWLAIGAVIGVISGFLIGKMLDKDSSKA